MASEAHIHQGPDAATRWPASGPRFVASTAPYRTGAGPYLRAAISRIATRRWWLFVIPLAAALIASAADIRWLFASLCILLVSYPFLIAWAYAAALVTPEARRALKQQSLAVWSDGSLTLYYFRPAASEADSAEDAPADSAPAEWEPDGSERIPASAIVDCAITSRYVRFTLRTGRLRCLFIPVEAFTPESLAALRSL